VVARTSYRPFALAIAVLLILNVSTPVAGADAPSPPYVPISSGGGGHAATSRIKDIANFEGVRQNQLIGYGLVVGLNNTGDTLNNSPFTRQSLQAMLERLGVNIRGTTLRTGNVAAVMVTANLPAFATQGSRIDVTVSALGDSKSLNGGTLLGPPRWRAYRRRMAAVLSPALIVIGVVPISSVPPATDVKAARLAVPVSNAGASPSSAAPEPRTVALDGGPATGLAEKFAGLSSSEPGISLSCPGVSG
jgi:hypothetical protein